MLPATIRKLRNGGDEQSAAILESVIYPEEVTFFSGHSLLTILPNDVLFRQVCALIVLMHSILCSVQDPV